MPKITWKDKACDHYWVIKFDHLQGVFERSGGRDIKFDSAMELVDFIREKQSASESHANASIIARIYNQDGKLDDTQDYPAAMNYHVNGTMIECKHWKNGEQSMNEDGAHFMSFDPDTGRLVRAKNAHGASWTSNEIERYNVKVALAAARIPADVTMKYEHS